MTGQRSSTGSAGLASFGTDRKRLWILKFEDADRGDMHFDDEGDAHHAYENFSVGWNCTLLETAARKYEMRCGQMMPLSGGATQAAPDLIPRSEFEIVRSASRMFEDAASLWMDRALKAEAVALQPASNALSEILKHVRAPNRPISERLDRIEEICTGTFTVSEAYRTDPDAAP